MNKVEISGRLTKDPEVKQTSSNIAVCSFAVAVDRRFKSQSGERETDFIDCVAWRQQATLLGQYFHKGSRIEVVGTLQTRTYVEEDTKKKRKVTEVYVEEINFVDTKADAERAQQQVQQAAPAQTPPPVQAVVPEAPVQELDIDGSAELPFDVMGYN